MLVKNHLAVRSSYPAALAGIMSVAQAKTSRRWLSHWSALNPSPTPIWNLPDLARRIGVREVVMKDESSRSPLGSFKALGAPNALLRLVLRRLPGLQPEDVLRGHHVCDLHDLVVVSATDGNHGRALAAAARSVGVRCVIVLHKKVSTEREAAIAALGATIVRVEGNYDDSPGYTFAASAFAAQTHSKNGRKNVRS